MAEKWEEYYTKEQLKKLQDIERENLRVFIDICEKLNLEYFVYGGTLLGVEKYNGMIPWDDDIDVALPRESYDRFVKNAHELLPAGYIIQTPENCIITPFSYTKLRNANTKYVEYVHRNININTGVYIDIYPVDKIPDDEGLRKKQFKKVHKWMFIYDCRQSRLYDKDEKGFIGLLKKIIKWFICNGLKIFSQKYCMKKINYYMTMYNDVDSRRYAALHSPNYNNIYLDLFPLRDAIFDGIKVKIPNDHKTHLTMRYGDYSGIPDEVNRIGHIPYVLELGN